MSLQLILDACSGIQINRREMVGVQYTKSEQPRTTLTPTTNPWRFTLEFPAQRRYSDMRSTLEALDNLDRYTPTTVTFGNNACLSWIFRYQGAMTQGQINAITVSSFTGTSLVLGNLPTVSTSTVLFEPNDLIQISGRPFPFTVRSQVLRGSSSTVTVVTHRPNILTTTVTSQTIVVGNACQFRVFCPTMPTYTLRPGGTLYNSAGTVVNNAIVEFSNPFELYEYTSEA